LEHQLPAPVLAVLIRNLRERKAIDRYDRLMHELVQVRQEMGYPPMAAPINRIAANQALANTLSDKRYQHIDQPFRDYVKGLYGAPPAPIDAEVRKRALGSSEAITMRPADLLQPGLERARREMRKQGLTPTGVDQVLTYILFPEEAPGILRPSSARRVEPAPASASNQPPEPAPAQAPVAAAAEPPASPGPAAREFTVEVDGEPYRVRILADGVPGVPPTAPRAAVSAQSAARPVAVYAAPDARATHTFFADERVALTGPSPRHAYLDIGQLVRVARNKGADAVHPGYGFLSENPGFAEACADNGLTFIGPSASSM